MLSIYTDVSGLFSVTFQGGSSRLKTLVRTTKLYRKHISTRKGKENLLPIYTRV